ncbi:MAG: ATP12 family chaperone protein, partial [Candidatus Devosia euplotis]|nr:ATP12 family chaperone protein [Candidatus Devosia euplotis]
MRDQLEDIQKHLDDGYGRAQYLNKVELPKRFYKAVAAGPVDGGFTVTLDGWPVKTPGRKIPIIVPAAGIATAMAGEWAAQGEFINPGTMPMVRLINSAVESGETSTPAFRDEIVKFAGGDLLLYRA